MTMMGKTTTMPTMLRIVPDSMDMQMHMFNAMYGVTENLTIMAMTSYVVKSMSMTTFKGMMGSTVLGTSSGTTDGLGDSMVGVNYRVYHDAINSVVAGLNLTLPTGSATRQITMLSPMASYMFMRAPYGMQTGSGSVSLVPSLAYSGHLGRWSWGLAYRGFYPMDYNSEGYRWGALSEFHGWGGYTLFPNITTTLHVVGSTQDHISGKDAQIYGLSQNANPLYYGGQKVRLLGGVEIGGGMWGYAKSSISVEAGGPIYQSLNGPQLGAVLAGDGVWPRDVLSDVLTQIERGEGLSPRFGFHRLDLHAIKPLDGRRCQDLIRWPFRADPPLFKQGHAVAGPMGVFGMMRAHDDAPPLGGERAQQRDQAQLRAIVQPGHRLVEHENFGALRQGAADQRQAAARRRKFRYRADPPDARCSAAP